MLNRLTVFAAGFALGALTITVAAISIINHNR